MEVDRKSNEISNAIVDPETTPLQLTGPSSPIDETQLEEQKESFQSDLIFPVESFPPWYITLIYAFQVGTYRSEEDI